MRLALLMVLFQFFAPAFLPCVVQGVSKANAPSYHVQHSSLVVPLLLKEKDEKEHEEFFTVSSLAPLLDLTIHSFNLTASHTSKTTYFSDEHRYDPQPSLFTRHCTFLI